MTAAFTSSRWCFAAKLLAASLLPPIVATALFQTQSDWPLNTPLVLLAFLQLMLGPPGGWISTLALLFVIVAVLVAVYEEYVMTTRQHAAVRGMLILGLLLSVVMLGMKLVVVKIFTGLSSL